MNTKNLAGENYSIPTASAVDDDDHTTNPITCQQTILEEVFTSDYNVTDEEVLEYCEAVGIDALKESHLLPLARSALLQPLPRPWTPVEDSRVGLYFFNQVTGESSWNHPVDAIVKGLVARDRNKTRNCTDSSIEDLNTDEDLISELLKGELSTCGDLTRSDCDVNKPSDLLATALTLAEQCTRYLEKSGNKSSENFVPNVICDKHEELCKQTEELNSNNNDESIDAPTQNKEETNADSVISVSGETILSNNNDTKGLMEVKIDKELQKKLDIVNKVESEASFSNYGKDSEEVTGKCIDLTSVEPEEELSSIVRLTPPDGAECDEVSNMFGGRDGLGRGLGRSALGPPPLGTPPQPLGPIAPLGSSLGRAPLGSGGPLGGSRIPPIGGHLTPLAPIAAANKGLPPPGQLSPLQPSVGSVQRQPVNKKDSRPSPLLQRQPNQQDEEKEKVVLGEISKKDVLRSVGRQQGDGESSAAGSPPKSILKGPVIAGRGGHMDRAQGLDRLALMESREAKNIRFDFETDELEFHSSEEDFEDEELEEELEEEEEYEEEEEEEFNSEAEDPEEEAILKARGVIDDESEGGGFVLNDAFDLLAPGSGPSDKQCSPSDLDPWANDEKVISKNTRDKNDPLSNFRKQKESSATEASNQRNTASGKSQPSQGDGKAPVNDKLSRPKSAVTQSSVHQQAKPQDSQERIQGAPEATKGQSEVKPTEERKLELEGAPKNRKVNPLDRVVAKLSGRGEQKVTDQSKSAATSSTSGATKNVTVNLTELMEAKEESEEEESQELGESVPAEVPSPVKSPQKEQEINRSLEEEEKRLRSELEKKVKALEENFKKEYQDLQNKLKQEHNVAIKKLQEEEKKKSDTTKKEIKSKLEEGNKKAAEDLKNRLEKEFAETKSNILKDLEEQHTQEVEQIKNEFVQDMKQKKEKLMKEHDEEMQELELELKALYDKEKTDKQAELQNADTASTKRNRAAEENMAIADLERNMAEVLRERQAHIKREHNRQLAILAEELEKELENAARQAKEKEVEEKKGHAAKLTRLKEEHEQELQEAKDSYEKSLHMLEVHYEEDLGRLKADFKAQLTLQKTELENKLTELKIEYEQRMSSLGHEQLEENEDTEVFVRRKIARDVSQAAEFDGITNSDQVHEEERKYDQILKELRERRKSLENDLEELKTQESQVKELKNKTMLPDTSPCCKKKECIHEAKYMKMKAKYSNLVSRIKSEKAKKCVKNAALNQESDINGMQSVTSTESNANASDVTSSIVSSPQHLNIIGSNTKSTSDASEDEEARFATQVLGKYGKLSDFESVRNASHSSVAFNIKHNSTIPITSTPKKAWVEDELLAHGHRELNRTEKFLKSDHERNHHGKKDLHVDDIRRELFRQNSSFHVLDKAKVSSRRFSLVPGGSLTSDTEESDEPTHDAPSSSSDFGLDQILAKISSSNKLFSGSHIRRHSAKVKQRPVRGAGSLERGLNNITSSLNAQSRGFNHLSTNGPLRHDPLQIGSAPDLGPETVDRIASVNQYLQQRWTNYFGELTVPLGGKAGWPSQVIGQSTLYVSKNKPSGLPANNQMPSTAGNHNSPLLGGQTFISYSHQEAMDINQKIDDLRAWLDSAQSVAGVPKEK